MKNNKFKKILAGVAGSALTILPVAATVSCGWEIKGDTVIFGVTFSQGKEQWNAVSDIIDNYNKEAKDQPDYMPVKLKNIGSGYIAGNEFVVSGMKNKSTDTPSLTVNYGTTIAEIVKAKRQINFADEKFKDYAVSADVFDEKFSSFNDKIQGVAAGGNYALPLLKSSIVFGINGPIFKYVFKTLQNAGYKVSDELKTIFKLGTVDWDKDLQIIAGEDYFGAARPTNEIISIFGDTAAVPEFTKSNVFGSFTQYLDFITKAIQMFKTSVKSETANKDKKAPKGKTSSVALLGIDDASGSLNTFLYSKLDANDGKMPMKVTQNDEGIITVDFKSILDPNNSTTKIEKEMYDKIKEAIAKGALKIYGGGAYASADEVNHKLGSNFGSTAGYSHNYIKTVTPYVQGKNKVKLSNILKIEEKDGKLGVGKYANPLLKAGSKAGQYDYVAVDAKYDANIAKIQKGMSIITVPENLKEDIAALDKETTNFEKIGIFSQKGTNYAIYIVKTVPSVDTPYGDTIKIIIPTKESTLGQDELVVFIPPTRYAADSKTQTAFLQGPNLYAIYKNEKLNLATVKFVKYLTSTTKHKFTDAKNVVTEETNFDHIARVASYIVPFKDFGQDKALDKELKKNPYLKIAFDALSSKDIKLYEEPSSIYSNAYRDEFNAVYKSLTDLIRKAKPSELAGFTFEKEIVEPLTPKINAFK